MSSTFFGLEIARSALAASQTALNIVGQNVSNINTEGYTRQSADMASINYSSAKSKLAIVGNLSVGQGVTIEKISQIRDEFLDISFRNAKSSSSKWDTELSALKDIENIFDETSTKGLNSVLGEFYDKLDDLSNNVDSVEYYNLVRSGALVITQVLNEYSSQISQIRNEQVASMEISTDDLNATINKINQLNSLIKDQKLRGSVSSDLLDKRNTYIDTVSKYININVKQQSDGSVSITSSGNLDVLKNQFSIVDNGDQVTISAFDGTTTQSFNPTEGSFAGFLNILNGKGTYADTLAGENDFLGLGYYQSSLDSFANAFAGTFNDINDVDNLGSDEYLFSGTTASTITLSDNWFADAKHLEVKASGTNDNILKMVTAMNDAIDSSYTGVSGTFEEFTIMLSSDVAQQVGYETDMNSMFSSILETTYNERESIMGVSIDEETINMTKYQKAFQAAARFMTVMDETLDIIINNMGVVGR